MNKSDKGASLFNLIGRKKFAAVVLFQLLLQLKKITDKFAQP